MTRSKTIIAHLQGNIFAYLFLEVLYARAAAICGWQGFTCSSCGGQKEIVIVPNDDNIHHNYIILLFKRLVSIHVHVENMVMEGCHTNEQCVVIDC